METLNEKALRRDKQRVERLIAESHSGQDSFVFGSALFCSAAWLLSWILSVTSPPRTLVSHLSLDAEMLFAVAAIASLLVLAARALRDGASRHKA